MGKSIVLTELYISSLTILLNVYLEMLIELWKSIDRFLHQVSRYGFNPSTAEVGHSVQFNLQLDGLVECFCCAFSYS